VFNAPWEQLSADANLIVGDVYGSRSIGLTDGPRHLRLRKLMLPAMRGAALEQWRTLMTDVAEREIRSLPTGRPVGLRPLILRAGLEIILRITVGAEGDELPRWRPLAELLECAVSRKTMALYLFRRAGVSTALWPRFKRTLDGSNRLVYDEIARRRANPHYRNNDLLDVLMHADGEPLTDQDLRDQLFTMIIAGHETSATVVCWAIERLIRHPDALAAATAEALAPSGGTHYVEAVIQETLRLRTPIPTMGRVTRTDFRLGDFAIPPKTLLVPHIRRIHERLPLCSQPEEFSPERFLENSSKAHDIIAFGGGAHRCLGDRLTLLQATIFLQTLLRQLILEPVDPSDEPAEFKFIINVPRNDTAVIAQRR
jgi:cytochrome P450 family 135